MLDQKHPLTRHRRSVSEVDCYKKLTTSNSGHDIPESDIENPPEQLSTLDTKPKEDESYCSQISSRVITLMILGILITASLGASLWYYWRQPHESSTRSVTVMCQTGWETVKKYKWEICGTAVGLIALRFIWSRWIAPLLECAGLPNPGDWLPDLPGLSSSGTKRALLICIGYTDQRSHLSMTNVTGFVMHKFLTEQAGFKPENITWMHDAKNDGFYRDKIKEFHSEGDALWPRRQQIETQIKTIVDKTKKGDSIFLYYTGHGLNQRQGGEQEADGTAEALIGRAPPERAWDHGCLPEDFVTQRWLKDNFSNKVPPGSESLVVFEACHSGTTLDLSYKQNISTGRFEKRNESVCAKDHNTGEVGKIVYLSGCMDTQTSMGFSHPMYGEIGGLLTLAFLRLLRKENKDKTLVEFVKLIREEVVKPFNYSDIPHLDLPGYAQNQQGSGNPDQTSQLSANFQGAEKEKFFELFDAGRKNEIFQSGEKHWSMNLHQIVADRLPYAEREHKRHQKEIKSRSWRVFR